MPVVTEGREQFHARPSEDPDAFTVVFYGRRNTDRKTVQADAKETASKQPRFVS